MSKCVCIRNKTYTQGLLFVLFTKNLFLFYFIIAALLMGFPIQSNPILVSKGLDCKVSHDWMMKLQEALVWGP
jgi:hypothetical protein